jgi:hypothetical protein
MRASSLCALLVACGGSPDQNKNKPCTDCEQNEGDTGQTGSEGEGQGGDSGSPDSGNSDSGASDGGSGDSAATDSGASDSGASDSGGGDSGASDSGSGDSGEDSATPVEPTGLCFNELMADNESTLELEEGSYPDWIELHNPDPFDVDLTNWTLEDAAGEPWPLNALGHIEAGGFLLLYADDQTELGPEHLPFQLAGGGDSLRLRAPDGSSLGLTFGEIGSDLAWSRETDCCSGAACWQQRFGGTPGVSNEPEPEPEAVEVLSAGSTWSYYDGAELPSADWASPSYDDSAWLTGPAPLGYGDTHILTTLSYGPDANNKYITAWFRRSVEVGSVEGCTGLELHLMRDDGALVWLNGEEVMRVNMPLGDVEATTLASASTGSETAYGSRELDLGPLVEGTNVIAVEVHQASLTSSDLGFDLSMDLLCLPAE